MNKVLLVLMFIAFLSPSISHAKAGCGPTNWLQCKSSTLYISSLTIPGTHDSGALWPTCVGYYPYTVAQTMSIYNQLKIGVRFLDIRFKVVNNGTRLRIFHNFCSQNIYGDSSGPIPSGWYSLIDDVLRFLREHPTETVIMSINDESGGNTYTFNQLVANLIARSGRSSKWWLNDSIPKLGQARGKIVLVRRFKKNVLNIGGMDASVGWPGNTTGSFRNFVVEDHYNGNTLTPSRKRDEVMKQLAVARGVLGGSKIYPLYLTFTSANNLYVIPSLPCNFFGLIYCDIGNYSSVVNPTLETFFSTHYGPYGVVIMDRVTPNLVWKVLRSNF
jgi:1-phosphatidylinositol phosphodiesterase